MSETRQRQRLEWVRRHWVSIAVAVGILGFLFTTGIAIWLGLLDVVMPLNGQETASWPAFVAIAAAILVAGLVLKRLL